MTMKFAMIRCAQSFVVKRPRLPFWVQHAAKVRGCEFRHIEIYRIYKHVTERFKQSKLVKHGFALRMGVGGEDGNGSGTNVALSIERAPGTDSARIPLVTPIARRRSSVAALAFLAGILAIAIAGCSRPINRTAERRIRDALPEVLGPARSYRVHVDGSAVNTVEGKISTITIDGDSVQLPNGFLVDNLHLILNDVNYDTDKGVVKSIGESHFVITAGEKALEEFLAGEEPEDEPIKSLQISLQPGNSISVNAKRLVLGVDVPFRITGPLHIPSPTKLEFDPRRLTVIGLPITGRLLRFITHKIETSVDLAALGVPVKLESVSTGRHTLQLIGSIDIGALLQRLPTDLNPK